MIWGGKKKNFLFTIFGYNSFQKLVCKSINYQKIKRVEIRTDYSINMSCHAEGT